MLGQQVSSLYAKIGADTSSFDAGMKRVRTGMTQAGAQVERSTVSWQSNLSKAALAFAAVGFAATAVYGQIKNAAALDLTRGRFANLTAEIGMTADVMLIELRAATRGMLSDTELLTSATDLLSLGLAKDREELERLVRVSAALNMPMNQLVLTLTNMTTMRFDALGVSVDGFDKKVKNLESTGLSASEAFKEAFLQQAEDQLARVGDAADTTAGRLQQLEVHVKNFFDTLAKYGLQAINPALEAMDYMNREAAEQAANQTLVNKAVADGLIVWDDYIGYLTLGGERLMNLEGAAEHVNRQLASQRLGLVDAGEGWRALIADAERWTGLAGEFDEVDFPTPDKSDIAAITSYGEALSGLTSSSSLDQLRQDLAFWAAGGANLTANVEFITSLDPSSVSPENIDQMLAAAQLEAIDIELALGEIDQTTADKARKAITDSLGIPLEEAAGWSDQIMANLNALDGMMSEANVLVHLSVEGATWVAELVGGASGKLPTEETIGGRPQDRRARKEDVAGKASGGPIDPSMGMVEVGEQGTEGMYWDPTQKRWVVVPHNEWTQWKSDGGYPLAHMAKGGTLGMLNTITEGGPISPTGGSGVITRGGQGSKAGKPNDRAVRTPGRWRRNPGEGGSLDANNGNGVDIAAAASQAAQAAAGGVAASSIQQSSQQSAQVAQQAIEAATAEQIRSNQETQKILREIARNMMRRGDMRNELADAVAQLV